MTESDNNLANKTQKSTLITPQTNLKNGLLLVSLQNDETVPKTILVQNIKLRRFFHQVNIKSYDEGVQTLTLSDEFDDNEEPLLLFAYRDHGLKNYRKILEFFRTLTE